MGGNGKRKVGNVVFLVILIMKDIGWCGWSYLCIVSVVFVFRESVWEMKGGEKICY